MFHLESVSLTVRFPKECGRKAEKTTVGEMHEAIRESLDDQPIVSARTAYNVHTFVTGADRQSQEEPDKVAEGVCSVLLPGKVLLGEGADPSEQVVYGQG